ncbi:MAG: hypothetical protein QXI89_01230 [Candidatus Anstonellales archaeon]
MDFKSIFIDPKLQIIILILLLLSYIIMPLNIKSYIGIIAGLYIISAFIMQTKESIKEHGIINELKELLMIIILIVGILMFLKFWFKTDAPISAIASCSMAKNINRGDLIFLSNRDNINAEIKINASIDDLFNLKTSIIFNNSEIATLNGSLFIYCRDKQNDICRIFNLNPDMFAEKRGPYLFYYGQCYRNNKMEPCITDIGFGDKRYKIRFTGDVIAYRPANGTLFSFTGDIVHRAIIEINDNGNVFYITKGDNNNIFDIQIYNAGLYNTPVSKNQVIGKVIYSLPYLGYYKLFISPYVAEDYSCINTLLPPS